jgi:2-(1,2-epoxy-1,2-dihydrophenyl)acetyl-CoA isomerase
MGGAETYRYLRTMYHPNVRVERDGHVATVTLDRPESKNACTGDMWVALGATFRDLGFSGARVIVLTGANENFCTGADLSGSRAETPDTGGVSRPLGTMTDAMRVLADSVLAIHQCPVPVVAKVDGLCVGAGLGLALAADLTYCSDRARFSAIFAKRGLSLDFGTSWLLRQRIGVHQAKELVFTAKMMSAADASAIGFVNAVFPLADFDAGVAKIVDTIAAGPPIALASSKRELDSAGTSSLAHALEVEALAQSVNIQTADMREAFAAYMERRPPTFEGR